MNIRYLAAAAHAGFWLGYLPLTIIDSLWPTLFLGPNSVISGGAITAMLLADTFGPGIAALVTARYSRWGGFLFSHGARALSAHLMAAVLVFSREWLLRRGWLLPSAVNGGLEFVSVLVLPMWFVLAFGAAFRALDGSPAWYPLLGRLIPDPPSRSVAQEPKTHAHGTDLHR